MMLVESKKYPERRALVRVRSDNSGRYYEDNYLAYLLKNVLEEKIGALAKEAFGECKIYYKLPLFVFPGEFRVNMGVEEFLRNPCAMPQFYLYPRNPSEDKEIWESRLDNFISQNAKKGYETYGELAFAMDDKGKLRYKRWMNE